MSTAIDSMLPSVTLPRFAPSSGANNKSSSAPQSEALFADNAGDFDFDMLAEYLLDEGTSSGDAGGDALGLSAFDFR